MIEAIYLESGHCDSDAFAVFPPQKHHEQSLRCAGTAGERQHSCHLSRQRHRDSD